MRNFDNFGGISGDFGYIYGSAAVIFADWVIVAVEVVVKSASYDGYL